MKNYLKYILILTLLALGSYFFYSSRLSSSKNNSDTNKMSVVKIAWGQFPSALIIADEKGFFADEGIVVQKENLPNLNLTIEALGRGEIDVASINYSTLFAYQNISPGKFKIFYGSFETKDNPYTLIIAKENIESPEELIGKKMAIRTGVHSEIEAQAVLEGMGIDPKKVELVVGETSFLITALNQPNISAVMAPESFATTILQKRLGKVLVNAPRSQYILDPYPTAAGVFSSQFVDKNPELSKKVKRAVDRAIDFMNNNQQETRVTFQKALNLEENIAMNMNFGENSTLAEMNQNSIQKLIDFQIENKLLEKRPDFSNAYYQE